jgi:hypothetical protein
MASHPMSARVLCPESAADNLRHLSVLAQIRHDHERSARDT